MSRPTTHTPLDSSLEFLSRSWRVSPSTSHLSKIPTTTRAGGDIVLEDSGGDAEGFLVFMNPFSFTSSETSQMVMDRILSHSQDVSPRTSGRLSHSSGPLNAGHSGGGSLSDSPPFSPSEIAELDAKLYRSNYSFSTHLRATVNGTSGASAALGGGKTVGRWLKERKERRKEENRVQNAQLHAAVSVAGVAAAIAAIASASASSTGVNDGEEVPKTDIAMASAATLVAAQCVEAAEAMGAEHDHLASVISSAVNVRSAGDIMTLTAAAATALRGAATLKSRAMKDLWNAAPVIPIEKGIGGSSSIGYNNDNNHGNFNNIIMNQKFSGELGPVGAAYESDLQIQRGDNFFNVCYRGLLANGCELLKRTRNGDLHWKLVSVYINRMNQVVVKMKSRHVAGTITKKKKNFVVDVVKDIPAWPGRHLLEGGEDRRYFGLKTLLRGVVEFECRNQREYEMWTQGVSKLLLMAAERLCKF
ncbi:VAN3-binding protein-like [Cucumis melo var. makuwa]|uniref:VAN3-binding protein-like n=1 Tax=Cucumis melo var. makuwa TaxID=1194695 RepID=A0A5A7U0G4_CUCMM|nr:VAN3-binding protein-like [Cucumis melo var. makuwa]